MNLGPPPSHADKQKAPVVKKFRRLALEGVADKLKNPSHEKQRRRVEPQAMPEDAGDKEWKRQQDGRNAQRVANPVYRMLMA